MKKILEKVFYALLTVIGVIYFMNNLWSQYKMATFKLPQEVTLHFGHQGVRDFYAYTNGNTETYPKSLGFSSVRWRSPNLGTIHLEHFGSTTVIPHVFWVMGTRDGKYTHGIGAMDITAGLSQAEFVTQEQAYQDYVALITAFKKAGWQQYFKPDYARIAKEDNVKILTYDNPDDVPDDRYVFNDGYLSDSLTPLSFEEWRHVIAEEEQRRSQFDLDLEIYLRDLYAHINIKKTKTKSNPVPNQPDLEQYMIDYTIENVKYKFFRGIGKRSVEEYYRYLKERANDIRPRNESRAIRAGFRINESYQDPDMWQYIIEPAY